MLHKPDREPIYGVRGNMPFFKEWLELFSRKERTCEKTFVFFTRPSGSIVLPCCQIQLVFFYFENTSKVDKYPASH